MASDSSIQYSIVVPFFNEQENIPPLYMKLTEVMDGIGEPYELVFVDDGSKDDSFKVLTEIYEHDRRVNLVRLRRNFGQTPALKAGFDFARGDRKSTRLNSSHVRISYAVFCLKKKKLYQSSPYRESLSPT